MNRLVPFAGDLRGLKPIRPHLFLFDEDGLPHGLRGCRCEVCGRAFFPARHLCTHCYTDGRVVDWTLPNEGVVYASTVARIRSAVGHEAPHAYGYVSLGNNEIRIFGPFVSDQTGSLEPGCKVCLGFGRVAAAGVPSTLGYFFVPLSGAKNE